MGSYEAFFVGDLTRHQHAEDLKEQKYNRPGPVGYFSY